MELDTLKTAWRDHERRLDANLALSRRLLETIERDRARGDVRRAALGPLVELALDALALLLAGSFVGDHLAQPAMLVPGLMLLAAAIALVATGVRQLVVAARIDYGAPVVAIQRDIAMLAHLKVAKTRAVLVAAPLLWAPLLVVGLQGLFGIDAYAALGVPFVAAQFAFGVAAIAAVVALAPRLRDGAFWRRLRDDIVGANLAAARARLDALARFEREA